MPDFQPDLIPPAPSAAPTLTAPWLFAWRGGDILLLGERDGGRWVVARGWRQADRLSDIRRWSFPNPGAFAVQIRRLARDATDDPAAAHLAATAAAAWAATQEADDHG